MTPERVTEVLAVIKASLLKSAHQTLAAHKAFPSGILLVSETADGEEVIGTLPVLDLQQREQTLRTAIRVEKALGYVFAFDGFIEQPSGRLEAILIVTATPSGAEGVALPYRRTVEGLVTYTEIEAPKDMLGLYQRVFS